MASDLIIIEFIIGYCIATYFESVAFFLQIISNKIALLMVILSLIPVLLEYVIIPWVEDFHVSVMLIPSVFIFLGVIRLFYIGGYCFPKFIIFTSKISYTIYLLHMAVIFSNINLSKVVFGADIFDSFSARFNLFVFSIISTWIVSFVFYKVVEVYLTRILKRAVLNCFKDQI